jgi:hypothetical protein
MFAHAAKRAATGLTVASAFVIIAGTATAYATDAGTLFLRELRQHGIAYQDPNATAKLGNSICRFFDDGQTYPEVQSDISGQPAASGFSADDVVVVIHAAIDTMCPQFADRLPS